MAVARARLERGRGERYRLLEDESFLKLKGLLTEIIGEDEAEIVGIRRESAFMQDLMIDSIQVVALAEMLNRSYNYRVNFTAWLSRQPYKKLISITVGDVSTFIADELSVSG